MTKDTERTAPQPMARRVAELTEGGAAGVETAMRVFEDAEQVYYGAVVATTLPVTVTTTATTPHAPGAAAP